MKVPALLLLCLVAVCVQGRIGDHCQHQSECDPGECCQILSLFPVVSKRQLVNIQQPREGTCQRYKLQDEHCSSFEHINGYCGCGPGLQCQGFEVKLSQPVRRSMVAPRPGYTWEFKCTPKTN